MAPILVPLAVVVVGSAAPVGPQWCQAPLGAQRRERVAAPSLTGLPGLYEAPIAASFQDRSTALSFNSVRTANISGQTQQRNGFVAFGFLPRLTLVARGSVMDNAMNAGMRDLSASAHVLLARESGWAPSIAIGAQDIGGAASHFEARYAVASKTLAGRARISAGFGTGTYSLDGAFGGIEVAPCSWLTLIAENESKRRNFGVRLAPLGAWGVRRGIEPTFDLLWREGQGRMAGVGLRLQAGAPFPVKDHPATTAVTSSSSSLAEALVAHGFENVRVATVGDTLAVSYENRVFNREEWDALGVVMGEAARRAGTAGVMRITILRLDLPVMRVVSGVAAFSGFVAGALDGAAFSRQLVVSHPGATDAGPVSNRSRFHLDITARPRIESMLLTEISVLESRLSLLPEATLALGRGLSLTGRRAVVVHRSQKFPEGFDEPNADQLLLHASRNGIPFAPSIGRVVSQLTVGRFGLREVGGAAAVDFVSERGRFSLGGVVAAYGEDATKPRRSVALGSFRLREAPLDLSLNLTAGRFFHGDVGGTAELERRFGPSEVAFYFQKTDIAAMAGVRVSVPLTFARDLRPGPVRVRLPEYGDFRKQTMVLNESNDIRTDVAQPLETGQELLRVFRSRDRLNAVRLLRDVEALRRAALRWVGR